MTEPQAPRGSRSSTTPGVTSAIASAASANNFTFTGHEKDEETGLIYAKARFYDPDMVDF